MNTQNTTATTTAALNAKISEAIITGVRQGMTLPQAINAVLGEGSYESLASDIYDALRG